MEFKMTETDVQSVLWQFEGSKRTLVLLELLKTNKISATDANPLIKDQWVGSELNSQLQDTWQEIFKYFQPSAQDNKLIRRFFKVDRTVYRGGTKTGISWTLDKHQAQWFAGRFNQHSVHQRTVNAKDVWFIINGPEKEIVLK